MKKTVIFDFPDNFEFPEHFEEMKPCRCVKCPFYCNDNYGEECFLTGDNDGTPVYDRVKCPFYDGEDTVNF